MIQINHVTQISQIPQMIVASDEGLGLIQGLNYL